MFEIKWVYNLSKLLIWWSLKIVERKETAMQKKTFMLTQISHRRRSRLRCRRVPDKITFLSTVQQLKTALQNLINYIYCLQTNI